MVLDKFKNIVKKDKNSKNNTPPEERIKLPPERRGNQRSDLDFNDRNKINDDFKIPDERDLKNLPGSLQNRNRKDDTFGRQNKRQKRQNNFNQQRNKTTSRKSRPPQPNTNKNYRQPRQNQTRQKNLRSRQKSDAYLEGKLDRILEKLDSLDRRLSRLESDRNLKI